MITNDELDELRKRYGYTAADSYFTQPTFRNRKKYSIDDSTNKSIYAVMYLHESWNPKDNTLRKVLVITELKNSIFNSWQIVGCIENYDDITKEEVEQILINNDNKYKQYLINAKRMKIKSMCKEIVK